MPAEYLRAVALAKNLVAVNPQGPVQIQTPVEQVPTLAPVLNVKVGGEAGSPPQLKVLGPLVAIGVDSLGLTDMSRVNLARLAEDTHGSCGHLVLEQGAKTDTKPWENPKLRHVPADMLKGFVTAEPPLLA